MPIACPTSCRQLRYDSWDDDRLLSGIAGDVLDDGACHSLSFRNWGFPSFRDLLSHEILSEYDASLLSKHILALGIPLSENFRSFEGPWLADELRHHNGFRRLYARLYEESVRDIDAKLEGRSAQFEGISSFLRDEFGLLVLLGYDEIVTTKAYVRDFPIYDSFGRPEISRFIRLVARDEARHFQRIVEILRERYAGRLSELPAVMDLIADEDGRRQSYRGTFVLDHGGFPPELLAAASALLMRRCGQLRAAPNAGVKS